MTADEVLAAAERAFMNGDFLGADRVLGTLWKDTTNAPPAVLHLLGAIHHRTNDFAGAEQFLRRAIKAAPREARHHAALGDLLMAAGHPGHAAASYAEAQRLEPSLPRIRSLQARALFHAGRFDEAEKAARAMLAEGRTAEGCDILSCALRELGRWKEAATAAEEALTLEPGNVQALHSRAAAWTFLGRDRDALDTLETLTVAGVETPALWYFRSRALINLKRQSEAAGLLADGLRKWPGSERLRTAYAELLSRPR